MNPLFAITDAAAIQIANLIVGCVTTCGMAWIGYLTFKVKSAQAKNADVAVSTAQTAQHAANSAASTAAQVKSALQITTDSRSKRLDDVEDVMNRIHSSVNSAMVTQLQLNATMARRIANMPGASAADIEAADAAEALLKKHVIDEDQASSLPLIIR